MTIQDAINSGKRFRRPKHIFWYELSYDVLNFNRVDILATDWEIETTSKTLSAQDIRDAAKAVRLEGDIAPQSVLDLELIINRLGL